MPQNSFIGNPMFDLCSICLELGSSGMKEYDFVKKNWGYYATPSINSRLKIFNFNTEWCGWSKRFQPEWDKFTQAVKANPNLNFTR